MLGTVARVGALLALAGTSVIWIPFKSPTYPYTISQPSSYKHIVIQDTSGRPVDYFFPSLGSQLTNVNIYCDHDHSSEATVLRSSGGNHVHRVGRILIDGHTRVLVRADYHGIPGHWTIEKVSFSASGRVWHLTISYEHRFRSQRPLMIRMIKTFKPGAPQQHRKA